MGLAAKPLKHFARRAFIDRGVADENDHRQIKGR
jgi:hypothetical protein